MVLSPQRCAKYFTLFFDPTTGFLRHHNRRSMAKTSRQHLGVREIYEMLFKFLNNNYLRFISFWQKLEILFKNICFIHETKTESVIFTISPLHDNIIHYLTFTESIMCYWLHLAKITRARVYCLGVLT